MHDPAVRRAPTAQPSALSASALTGAVVIQRCTVKLITAPISCVRPAIAVLVPTVWCWLRLCGVGAGAGVSVGAVIAASVGAIVGASVDAVVGAGDGTGAVAGEGVDAVVGEGVVAVIGERIGAGTGAGVTTVTMPNVECPRRTCKTTSSR